jgi:LacI family transcriptional regulator
MPRTTIDDVARRAGVSIKTVSRVLNGEPNVRHSTRDRVNAAITELNYRPNVSARNLAARRSRLVVLVYDDPSLYEAPSAGYVVRLQEGALRACRAVGYELLIHPCNYRDEGFNTELRSVIGQMQPNGIVLAAPVSNIPGIVTTIADTNTPFVRLSPGDGGEAGLSISTDDRQISAEMTRYLASLGHRRIAFIAGNPGHTAVVSRLSGYEDGLRETGLAFSPEFVAQGDNSIASGEAAAESLLSLPVRPTAIFAANDDMAAGVLRVAYRRGLAVPGSLSVAGFDDSALALQVYPALTTVRQPLVSMAERAVHALIRPSVDADDSCGPLVIPSRLVIRDSTGPAPD